MCHNPIVLNGEASVSFTLRKRLIGLLSTIADEALQQELVDIRHQLMDEGIPSLWCPKSIIPVDEIPLLASGKLDLKACNTLAQKSSGE